MNLAELAGTDLQKILDSQAGTEIVIIDPETKDEFLLNCSWSDIGYSLNEEGAAVAGRTITACYRFADLERQTGKTVTKGFKIRNGNALFKVSHCEPDRSLGINRLVLTI